jgi:hypothetical protein
MDLPDPGCVVFFIPPQHPFVFPEILNPHALLAIQADGDQVANLDVLIFREQAFCAPPA